MHRQNPEPELILARQLLSLGASRGLQTVLASLAFDQLFRVSASCLILSVITTELAMHDHLQLQTGPVPVCCSLWQLCLCAVGERLTFVPVSLAACHAEDGVVHACARRTRHGDCTVQAKQRGLCGPHMQMRHKKNPHPKGEQKAVCLQPMHLIIWLGIDSICFPDLPLGP